MKALTEVSVPAQPLDRFEPLVGPEAYDRFHRKISEASRSLAGRTVWTVNSTAQGGGVAEMLHPIVGYALGEGINARWLVIAGSEDFFRVTKRIHHALHGSPGDRSPLGDDQRAIYETTLAPSAAEMMAEVSSGDIAILHDPQTAGLAPALMRKGVRIVWRCHIGTEEENEQVFLGSDFLRPYLEEVPITIVSRDAYRLPCLRPDRTAVIAPSIDPFSAKNQDMDDDCVRATLIRAGLVGGSAGRARGTFVRKDGSAGQVTAVAETIRVGTPPSWDAPSVVQVSRWDPLKDHVGVMHGFARMESNGGPADAHLLLVGPALDSVADDPEAIESFEHLLSAWRGLPLEQRRRVDLVLLPMVDAEENAAIVNAIQRHATVVVQKSLKEGFGLTVAEAMWKSRPVLASRVGGIQDQISSGENGLLVDDPTDLNAFATLLRTLLCDPEIASQLGSAARERVSEQGLSIRSLFQFASLLERLHL